MKLAQRLLVEHIRKLAEQKKTRAQVAQETGLSYARIVQLGIAHDIDFRRKKLANEPEHLIRAADMRQRYENGETLIQIGARYGVTRERVRQILTRDFGIGARDGGKAEMGRRKRRELQKKRDARSQKMWGCSHREYLRILKRPDKPTFAYWGQQKNARRRGIGWEINLWQWWKVWQQSGRWDERGRGHGYQMCRLNDTGPYSVDNVYIATGSENMQDYWAKKRAESVSLEAQQ